MEALRKARECSSTYVNAWLSRRLEDEPTLVTFFLHLDPTISLAQLEREREKMGVAAGALPGKGC